MTRPSTLSLKMPVVTVLPSWGTSLGMETLTDLRVIGARGSAAGSSIPSVSNLSKTGWNPWNRQVMGRACSTWIFSST